MNINEIQELLQDALSSDLEQGVKWLNENAADEFLTKYPELNKAIIKIMKIEE